MPFMCGPAPIRRTLKYLEQCKLIFLDRVKIMSLNYNTAGHRRDAHKGMQDFVFWDLPKIQYKNPDLQVVIFKNITPAPFVRFWLDDGREVIMEVDGKSNAEIVSQMHYTLGKTNEQLKKETLLLEKKDTPANLGRNYNRFCLCEIEGQVPCPGLIPLPKEMRGKYIVENLNKDK